MSAIASAATIVVLNVVGLQPVPRCGSAEGACQQVPLNVHVTPPLQSVVSELLSRSETFRRQCAKIARTPGLRVAVGFANAPMAPLTLARARALRYDSGILLVSIEVPAVADYVALLAHEFEHVTEFIDRIDFRARADESTDVIERADGSFETERARAAARAASREVYGDVDPTIRAAGRFLRRATRVTWRTIARLGSR